MCQRGYTSMCTVVHDPDLQEFDNRSFAKYFGSGVIVSLVRSRQICSQQHTDRDGVYSFASACNRSVGVTLSSTSLECLCAHFKVAATMACSDVPHQPYALGLS